MAYFEPSICPETHFGELLPEYERKFPKQASMLVPLKSRSLKVLSNQVKPVFVQLLEDIAPVNYLYRHMSNMHLLFILCIFIPWLLICFTFIPCFLYHVQFVTL